MLIFSLLFLIFTKQSPPLPKSINLYNEDILGYFKIKYVPKYSTNYKTCLVPFVLFKSKVPKTVNNFIGISKGLYLNNIKYEYKSSIFHRIINDFVLQGGDVIYKNGYGSISIYNTKFDDENFLYKNIKGSLSMANSGKNTNGSQFFICLNDLPHLDNHHVVFGHVLVNEEVLKDIGRVDTGINDKPVHDVIIDNIKIIGNKRDFVSKYKLK